MSVLSWKYVNIYTGHYRGKAVISDCIEFSPQTPASSGKACLRGPGHQALDLFEVTVNIGTGFAFLFNTHLTQEKAIYLEIQRGFQPLADEEYRDTPILAFLAC